MSPLCLVFFVKAVLALNAVPTSELTPASQQQSSLNVRRFDESAQSPANSNVETPSVEANKQSSLNVRRIDESMSKFDEAMRLEREAQVGVTPEVANIEVAAPTSPAHIEVATPTSMKMESEEAKEPSPFTVRRFDESMSMQSPVSYKAETPPGEANKQSSLNVRRIDESMSKFDEAMRLEREAQAGVTPEVANIEVAAPTSPAHIEVATPTEPMSMQSPANSNVETPSAEANKQSSLNVRRIDESMSKFDEAMRLEREGQAGVTPEVANIEAAFTVRRFDESMQIPGNYKLETHPPAEATQQSSLNVRRFDESVQAPADNNNVETPSAEAKKPSSLLNVRRVDESMSRFDEAMKMEREGTAEVTPEVVAVQPSTPETPSPAEPSRKSKKVAMHDMPHYRNHGAAMYHVEPTPVRRSSATSKTSSQPAADQEQAANLAEKREEVEDFFHLSSSKVAGVETTTSAPTEVAAGAGRSLFRYVFLGAALLSVASLAYQKYEVLTQICQSQGKSGPARFKAKQEDDMGGFAAAPALPQYTSFVETARQGLSRRSRTADTMSSCELGV